MRIGSAITFLVASWIGLGYLLSDNINTRQALSQAQEQVSHTTQEKNDLQQQLNMAVSQNATLKQHNGELMKQIHLLQEQVGQLQIENDGLAHQISDLRTQLNEARKINVLASKFEKVIHQPFLLALFVPILPPSLVASYAVYRYSQHRSYLKAHRQDKRSRPIMIRVTEQEKQQIISVRRGSELPIIERR